MKVATRIVVRHAPLVAEEKPCFFPIDGRVLFGRRQAGIGFLCFNVDQLVSFDLSMSWYPYYFELKMCVFAYDFVDAIEDVPDD